MSAFSHSTTHLESPAATSTGPISILLVDDDPKNLLALESILESPEHHLVKALTADAALIALLDGDYAAIVLDVQMPDLNGIELARLIKQRRRTQHIPIIFLSAHYRESEHAVLGYDVGAVDYLTKPVNPAVLRSKVSVFVDLFRKTAALAEMNRNMEAEIVERKTAEERFRVVVEAAPSAMLVFDSTQEIALVNSQAERLYGQTREALLSRKITELIPDTLLPSFFREPAGIAVTVGRSTPPRELAIRRANGDTVPVEVSFTPIQSNEGLRSLASIVDITERKRADEALRKANQELEAKNVALQAQAEAEAANAAKDRFLAMLSHELRTPLSPVLHAVTLLEEPGVCSPESHEALQVIRRNVQLEARLIDDLLDLARIRNGKLKLHRQSVDIHDPLLHALRICQADIDAHGLRTDITLHAKRTSLDADPARLQQIFWNLVSNAVKFTPSGGSIAVSTEDDDERESVRIIIADNGVGVDPEKLPRIFDAFEQVARGSHAGLGLGLAICQALVTFHGGEIIAESEGFDRGTKFIITLPVSRESTEVAKPERKPAERTSTLPLRLLVVEDHQDTADTLLRLLTRRGYDVQSASSVAEALEISENFDFDVVVSDIGLPDGTGIDLFQQLRTREKDRAFCGIALSGFGMDEDIARSMEAGFSQHLTKPVDFTELQRCLDLTAKELAGRIASP